MCAVHPSFLVTLLTVTICLAVCICCAPLVTCKAAFHACLVLTHDAFLCASFYLPLSPLTAARPPPRLTLTYRSNLQTPLVLLERYPSYPSTLGVTPPPPANHKIPPLKKNKTGGARRRERPPGAAAGSIPRGHVEGGVPAGGRDGAEAEAHGSRRSDAVGR